MRRALGIVGGALAIVGALLLPAACEGASRAQYLREMDRRLGQWTEPTVNAVSYFETSRMASYDKVSTDFDCEGLSVGILQWAVGQGSFLDLLARADSRFLAAEMGAAWPDLEALIATMRKERAANESGAQAGYPASVALTRTWQTPDFDAAKEECTRAKSRGPVAFKPEKEALKAALEKLLAHPRMQKAQLAAAREKGRCAYHLASLWTWKRLDTRDAGLRLYLRTCEDIDPADFPRRLPSSGPSYAEFLYFYDLVNQLGLGAQSALQDLAIDIPAVRASGDAGARHLAGRLHNTVRLALGWLSRCWDWQESGVCRALAAKSTAEKRARADELKAAATPEARRQRAVLSHHLQGVHNAEAWGRVLDEWQKTMDSPTPLPAGTAAEVEGQLRLAVHASLAAGLAYRDYAVNVMNRKATFAFGHGCVTGTVFDFRPFIAAVAKGEKDWTTPLRQAARGSCVP